MLREKTRDNKEDERREKKTRRRRRMKKEKKRRITRKRQGREIGLVSTREGDLSLFGFRIKMGTTFTGRLEELG